MRANAISVVLTALLPALLAAAPSEATGLLERSEDHVNGKTLQIRMKMTIRKAGSVRELGLRLWMKGRDRAVIKIQSPPRERDQGNLRIKLDLWQYLPNVERIIRIPPSMMLQSWMGSDFSNDDLVRAGNLLTDYTHALGQKTNRDGVQLQEIICTP